MLFKTLASKLSGEKRWLRQWKEEDKKDYLWNEVADLIEHMLDNEVNPETVQLVFTSKSSGYSVKESLQEKNAIAVMDLAKYPKFIEFCPKLADYTTEEEEKKYIMPIINDIYAQVYG